MGLADENSPQVVVQTTISFLVGLEADIKADHLSVHIDASVPSPNFNCVFILKIHEKGLGGKEGGGRFRFFLYDTMDINLLCNWARSG